MENSEPAVTSGLRSSVRKVRYSQDTHDMLNLMMQEKDLTVRQKQHINKCLKSGTALPREIAAPSVPPKPKPTRPVKRRPQAKRSAEACRSWVTSIEEPPPLPAPRNWEEEKLRLQNTFQAGKEPPSGAAQKRPGISNERVSIDEVLDAIQERRQFLADMAALGQEKRYIDIINNEIAQKLRELKMLEKEDKLK
ncbi:UPF0193 protein EVG1-like [Neosynchiropus ocellatus]